MMRFSPIAVPTLKRDRCTCDRELFPDDCDCGYEEQQQSTKRKLAEDEFLRSYTTSIFPRYKQYMRGEEDGIMWWRLGVGDPPTTREKRDKMIEAVARERIRLILIPVEQPNEYWEEWETLNECLAIMKEYHDPPGYRGVKMRWDNGTFCKEGTLKKGNAVLGNIIGEVVDFVSPSVEVEKIVEKHIKAIAVVETWKTKEQFIEAWETDVFGGQTSERALSRYVYLGWKLYEYIGIDNPITKANARKIQNSVQFDRCKLGNFWDKARITVKAMLIVDCLDMWAYNCIVSGVDRPFLFEWDHGDA